MDWRLAILAAAARAYTSHEPDPTVRNPDWLADPLLSPEELARLEDHPVARAVNQDFRIAALSPDVGALARPFLVATRYIDERLDRALRDGFAQVAILDAGLDSRAWRLRPRFQNRRVIELDDAASQAAKRLRVETVLGPSPPFLTYAAFQAQRGDLAETLRAAGLRPLERAFFIWEGASVYYTEAAARRTLRAVAQTAAPGSRLAMDFVPASQVARVNRDPASPQARWDASWGHPWSFGVPDAAPQGFFRDLGFQARDVLDTNGEEAARRYLTRRDGTVFGPPPNAPGTGLESYLRRVLVELVVPD